MLPLIGFVKVDPSVLFVSKAPDVEIVAGMTVAVEGLMFEFGIFGVLLCGNKPPPKEGAVV